MAGGGIANDMGIKKACKAIIYRLLYFNFCCPTRARTSTYRSRICRTTIILSGNWDGKYMEFCAKKPLRAAGLFLDAIPYIRLFTFNQMSNI